MSEAEKGAGWQDYTELKGMVRALGDIARLNLIRVLADGGEVNVTDLAQALLISQPLVSWHLSALRRHGLVRTRRQGRQVYCSLNIERYRDCLRMLAAVIGDSATLPTEQTAVPGEREADARPHQSSASARSRAPSPR